MAEGDGRGKWQKKWERLKATQENEQERSHEVLSMGLDHGIAYATGGGVAYLHGRKGGMPAVAKLPIDALAAGVGTLAGFGLVMTGRSYGRHVAAAGLGPGVWFVGYNLAKIGQRRRIEAGDMLSSYDDKGNLLAAKAMTDAEAEEAGVQPRAPITAGRAGMDQPPPQRRDSMARAREHLTF